MRATAPPGAPGPVLLLPRSDAPVGVRLQQPVHRAPMAWRSGEPRTDGIEQRLRETVGLRGLAHAFSPHALDHGIGCRKGLRMYDRSGAHRAEEDCESCRRL